MGKKERVERAYKDWQEHRDEEEWGFYCAVKLLCDNCGKRWVDFVRLTLPPCPRCGSREVFEYETVCVG